MLIKILQSIIFGLFSGSLYGIMGLGLSLIYRTTGVMNFAQGNSGMIGVFVGWTILVLTNNLFLAILGGLFFASLLGIFMDKILMKKVKGLTHGSMLIITLGVLLVFEGIALIIWGTQPLLFKDIFSIPPKLVFLPDYINPNNIPLIIPGNDFAVFLVATLFSILIILFSKFTKPGLALIARSEDEVGAKVIGININFTDSLAWALGISTAVLTGFLVSPKTTVNPVMLINYQLYGFTAAVFGGFSSFVGSFTGGIILGVLEKLVILGLDQLFAKIGITTINSVDLQLSIILLIIIITLIIKPTGLFGAKFKGKV
ncbi:MAG: branched-chain amino acid ABC transporter permease [Exilispira sp.]